MSNNRKSLVSDIRDLDRGITDAEKFLGKVLAKKIESARRDGSSASTKKKNVPKRGARSESRTPPPTQSKYRASSAHLTGVSSMSVKGLAVASRTHATRNAPRIGSSKRLSPEPHHPKQKTESRSRSNSVSVPASQCNKCDTGKQTTPSKHIHHAYIPQLLPATKPAPKHSVCTNSPNRHSTPPRQETSPKAKQLPWRDILREPHKPGCKLERGHWDIAGREQKSSAKTSSASINKPTSTATIKAFVSSSKQSCYNSKVPHDCELPKTEAICPSTAVSECSHFFKMPSVKIPEESFSSEGTSGFSSNNEVQMNLTNKSVLCLNNKAQGARPKSVPTDLGFRSGSSASHKSDEKMRKIAGILGADVFSMFNPVRTLQFLIKELQGMVHKNGPSEDPSVTRIIADIDKVLQRLAENDEPTDSSSGYTTHSKPPRDSRSAHSYSSCVTSDKHADIETERVAIVKALAMVPALAKKIDERTESMRKKILESKVPVSIPPFQPVLLDTNTDTVENIIRLQRHVENSGGQLEAMCRSMEKTCDSLRHERDTLKAEVQSKQNDLVAARTHEQDFITTVNSLRTTLETTTRRATQLSTENKMMKEQLRLLPALQESEVRVKQLTAELNLLREEVKDIPNLKAAAEELTTMNETLNKLQAENKELNELKYLEEKYKDLSAENTKLKEENKVLPHFKGIEQELVKMTQSMESLKEEKKVLEEKLIVCCQEKQRLKDELQNKTGIKEATQRLSQRLQEAMKERDEAQHEQNMLKIEREKLLLLSRNKEEELNSLVKDIVNIKNMVTEQLTCLKSNLKVHSPSISDVLNISTDSDECSNTLETVETLTATSRQPICSSPTSTASGNSPAIEDWPNMSTIVPDHSHSSPEIRLQDNGKCEQTESPEFKSLIPEGWHSLSPMGQGELNIPEDYPPRPRTAMGGRRPPTTGVPVGDNQWVGTVPVTQELQNNMQELFQFIHQSQNSLGSQSVSRVPSSLVTIPSITATVVASSSSPNAITGSTTSLTLSSAADAGPSFASDNTRVMPETTHNNSRRNFQFEMPKLPDPPKFLDAPEFSDYSSYPLTSSTSSSIESIDAVLKKLKGEQNKRKNPNKNGK